LSSAGLVCHIVNDLGNLAKEIERGAGAILLTEEILTDSRQLHPFVDWVADQEPWSDIPILLLSASGADSTAAAQAMQLMRNVTVLERPVRVTTLVSALRTAIRARRRQYELRDQLAELKHAEA